MKPANQTATAFGRATGAAIALSFSVGVAAGVMTFDGLSERATATAPADLMPAAGWPDLDLEGLDPDPLEVERPGPADEAAVARRARLGAGGAEMRHGPLLEPVGLPASLQTAALALAPAEGLAQAAQHAAAAAAEKAILRLPAPAIETVPVRRGDTLMNLLLRSGVGREQAHAAIAALEAVYDPRRLRAGQALEIAALDGDDDRRLVGLSFDISFDHEVRVERGADGSFAGVKVARPQHRQLVHRSHSIDDSLYLAADRAGVPRDVTIGLIKLFSWDVDFQRDLRAGDDFETLFEEVSLEDQEGIRRGGEVLYARLTLGGRDLDAYRFERSDGAIEYYDRTGRSLRKFLLRTPVDGARISSNFGMRRHPVLGYSRMHKGTDFAAPTGTPIYAAGHGRVETAGRNGGYGNYVRLRHNGEYSTAYAHLSRVAKGIAPGARVSQGQVIGYVGSTGRSTGPHLHYEVLRSGAQINPLSLRQPPAAQLAGAELEAFEAERSRIDRLRAEVRRGTLVASKTVPATSAIR